MHSTDAQFVATTSRGVEPVLLAELADLGIHGELAPGAVRFRGGLRDAYRACLHSRVASRVLLELARFPARDDQALYRGARAVRWRDHLDPGGSLVVDFVGTSDTIRNSRFGAIRVKDAVVDALRELGLGRPSVDPHDPDVRIGCRLADGWAAVSIDLSGAPLNQRGYRLEGGTAPLKENLAAAILHLAGWPAAAASGAQLVDPMCGSGTFLAEAAGIASGRAAGIDRRRWGFDRWLGHDRGAWASARAEALARPSRPIPPILGFDHDPEQVRRAREALTHAGFPGVQVRRGELADASPPAGPPGLLVTNPPYGERLGDEATVVATYRLLGDVLRRRFLGWTGWVLAGSPALGRQTGLRPAQRISLWNGRIECRLLEIPIRDAAVARDA